MSTSHTGIKKSDETSEEKKEEPIVQKNLSEFKNMPKQNMLLDLNPIMMSDRDQKINEEKLYKLRNHMEDPANQLKISPEMTIMGDNRAQILNLMNSICESILAEDKSIKLEIKQLDDNKVTQDQIENVEVQMSGISYTSILVYLNEIKNGEMSDEERSHKFSPGKAIVEYIKSEMDNLPADSQKWRNFPKVLMKAITSNTYFFTRMMEMCQYKQIRKDNLNLQVLSQIIYQVVKIGIQREYKSKDVPSHFYFNQNMIVNSVYTVMMMSERKLEMLKELATSWRYNDDDRKFALPGMVSANKDMATAFASLRSPLKNEGNFVKVMLRVKIDNAGDSKGTRTTCIVLNNQLSYAPEDIQVLMAIPYFKIMQYAFYKDGEKGKEEDPVITRNRPFHVFVVSQISYPSQYRTFQLEIGDLKLLTVVGEGAFGKVFLGKISTTNKYYGIKMLQKHKLLEKQEHIDYAKFEISVMKEMKHPNLLGIDFVKQMDHYLFLILPFSKGGDLNNFYKKKVRDSYSVFFEEEQILFFAIQIISAFGYLHEKQIVHRDVKMANILIDEKSNLMVCDFGLAHQFKSDDEWLQRCCGTPTTWAPEVVNQEKYRMMPDWWSVGVILYQMMCKSTPFELPKMVNTDNLDADKWKDKQSEINNERICGQEIKFNDKANHYSAELKDLVMKLLNRDQHTRIGSDRDSAEILEHPVFNKDFISQVEKGQYDAPLKPDCFDLGQDFDKHHFKEKIALALDCFSNQDKQKIDNENHKFADEVFGKTAVDSANSQL